MEIENSDDKNEKKPPTDSFALENDPELSQKIFSVLSYFIVLVIIGIPMWWYTTRVYRANLPLNEMYNVDLPNKTDRKLGIPLSLDYDILITIVNPEPENLHIDLNGEELDAALQPFLKKITPIADFVVKSQWLYLVELGAMPRKILDHYALNEEQLPHVITPLEKKLWSHLSPRPCLNLILYIPQCSVPLYIYDKFDQKIESNSFLSPRWGGIYILNPNKSSCEKKHFKPNLKSIIPTFTTQIKRLFHLDSESESDLFRLQKEKARDMIESTRRTLKSLAQLLSEISSIVISDDVARRIQIALDHAEIAEGLLKRNKVEEALKVAKIAFNNSEAAFSDPSLLALLYFPEDQKYAVYIPLFLPVMIPVFMSLITLRKWYSSYKAKKLKTE